MSENVRYAHSVEVGVCKDGDTVGLDLCGEDGLPFAHCHFDASTALELAEDFHKAIATLVRPPVPGAGGGGAVH